MTLKTKYILFTTCILFVTIGIFSYKNTLLQEKEIQNDEKERVRLISEIIKNSLVTMMLEGNGIKFQKFLESVTTEDIENARIFRPDGKIVRSSFQEQINTYISREHIEKFKTQKKPEVFPHKENKKTVYSIMVPIYNEHSCRRCHSKKDDILGVLDVEISLEKTLKKISALRERMIIFFIITLIVISIFLGMLTTRLVNKPIISIINTIKKAEEGDLTVKFFTQRKDEIGKLASSLNSMLFELDKARREIEKCHFEEMQNIEKMATIGELSAAVAHEIKNPLAGISGAIQVLAEDLNADDPRKEIINEVLNEIERLDRAVKDLIIFARPPEPHLIKTTIYPIIEQAKRLIAEQAEKQGVTVKLIPDDNITEINVDPQQMQQVFANIMLNALQSMPAGGKLTISAHLLPAANEIEIVFSDTGQGIEKQELENIFKPFFTTRHTGTGLGLAISRNIVEKHKGTIFVESQIGIGSSFHVILKK